MQNFSFITIVLLAFTVVTAAALSATAPTFDQYSMSAIGKILLINNQTYTIDMALAIDRTNKRLKMFTSIGGQSTTLLVYNALQWDPNTFYQVSNHNYNATVFKCQAVPVASIGGVEQLFDNSDVLNTFAQGSEFSGKVVTMNHVAKNIVQGANAFINRRLPPGNVLAVGYYGNSAPFMPLGFQQYYDPSLPPQTLTVTAFNSGDKALSDSDFSLLIAEPKDCTSNGNMGRKINSNNMFFGKKL